MLEEAQCDFQLLAYFIASSKSSIFILRGPLKICLNALYLYLLADWEKGQEPWNLVPRKKILSEFFYMDIKTKWTSGYILLLLILNTAENITMNIKKIKFEFLSLKLNINFLLLKELRNEFSLTKYIPDVFQIMEIQLCPIVKRNIFPLGTYFLLWDE